jgi:2,4-dienoyl-CoA reductase-like NADH-dependent reductase (Old Yellow Enzyme family)
VLEPARLGPVELRNRVIKAATFEGMTPHGLVTDELIEFHLRPARGGVGMTTVAYCAVSPEGRTDRHQMWMRPEAVPGLRRLAEAVHAEGAAISAQIGHAGPVAIQLTGSRFLRSYPYQEAYLLDRARQFRAALNLPLILLGGITRKQTMDLAMAEGFAFVAMARALLREPDLLHRIRSDPRARSLCIHCNKCMPTIYSGTHCVLASPRRT